MIGLCFLFSLLLVNSNIAYLAVTCLYLIIFSLKLQSYKEALLLVFLILLPFSRGKNLLEVTLIDADQLFGHSLFSVQYFFAVLLSDCLLLLIYQHYFSQRLRGRYAKVPIQPVHLLSASIFSLFLLLTLLKTLNSNFDFLLLSASLQIAKLLLIFLLPAIYQPSKTQRSAAKSLQNKSLLSSLYQVIIASTLFQSLLVIFEQIKGGNIGRFIENTLPGLQQATKSSEAGDVLRANGTFNEPNVTAVFLLMGLAFILPAILQQWQKYQNLRQWRSREIVLMTSCVLTLIAIIFTGSRSLYLLSLLFLTLCFLQYRQQSLQLLKTFWQHKLSKFIIVLVLILALPYLLLRASSLQNVFTSTGSFSYRQQLNNAVLGFANKNVLGIGLDLTSYYLAISYKTATSQFTMFDQAPAHNIFVQLLAETGIIATITFITMLFLVFRQGWRAKNKLFITAAGIYLLAAQFHPIFTTHLELSSFFFIYLGLALYADQI